MSPTTLTLKLELQDRETGRFDARAMLDLMGVSLADLARIIGADYEAFRKHPEAEPYQPTLARVASMLDAVMPALKDQRRIRLWLRTANPEFDGARALDLLLAGKLKALESWLYAKRTGQGV